MRRGALSEVLRVLVALVVLLRGRGKGLGWWPISTAGKEALGERAERCRRAPSASRASLITHLGRT